MSNVSRTGEQLKFSTRRFFVKSSPSTSKILKAVSFADQCSNKSSADTADSCAETIRDFNFSIRSDIVSMSIPTSPISENKTAT